MTRGADPARHLLKMADRDLRAFEVLAASDVDPAVAGFHAQQAVEKFLKAVLIRHGIEFRRTHDLAELMDLLKESGKLSPPHADRLDELNPYAVEFRYGLVEPKGLDRAQVERMLMDVRAWAEKQVG